MSSFTVVLMLLVGKTAAPEANGEGYDIVKLLPFPTLSLLLFVCTFTQNQKVQKPFIDIHKQLLKYCL